MNRTFFRGTPLASRLQIAIATMLVSMASAQAATTSFPQYPLLTGSNAIPPNVMLILDDSGSMAWLSMPDNYDSLSDNPARRSYVNNTLYYNPERDYRPWRTASTDLDDRLTDADFTAVSSSTTSLAGSRDLRDSSEAYFYVPKAGVSNPGTNSSNYVKYRIAGSSSSDSVNGGVVQRQARATKLLSQGTVSSITSGNWSQCFRVDLGAAESVTVTTSGGKGNGNLYVYSNSNCSSSWDDRSSTNNGNSESVKVNSPNSSISFRINAPGSWNTTNNVSNISYEVRADYEWEDATPTGRSQKEELQNFANWYQYHRTRNKMAKAGASEAFGRLGKNYRVGFDTIWNRGGKQSLSGSTPSFPIQWGTEEGLFTGDNRETFYSRLQSAGADGGTPLHGALQRAGRYFGTADPYKDGSGNMLSCRQNYALLTTDGFWNSKSDGFESSQIRKYSDGKAAGDGSGNVDYKAGYPYQDSATQDGYSTTLADVAYYYWQNDLRTDLANNVRTSSADSADWQHMTTFGISIGLQGTLVPVKGQEPRTWPNPNTTENATRIDDLWHASVNGRGSFVVASDTDKFASALTEALRTIDGRTASGSNIASSSTKTDSETLTFSASYTSASWLGELKASPFNDALTGVSKDAKWAMSKTFDVGGVNAGARFTSRTVLTSFGGVAQSFDSTTLASAAVFGVASDVHTVSVADNIAYLRGDRSKEADQAGGTLRKRAYPFGDIVDSAPAYIGDTKTVYVGANDGMMHGIDSETGKVLFSYVPGGLDFSELAKLSSPEYEHRYFVDGNIDVISQANQGNGRNILVGALGRGGRGVFALDVTTPNAMKAGSVLWDNTTQDSVTEKDMGYVLGAVRIRPGNNGKAYALVPNGIDSPNGTATLFAYELDASGGISKTYKLIADPGSGNGLMSLGMADLNQDGKVDVVYGGDLKGNVWRWDFTGSAPKAAVRLFQAKDSAGNPQPITGGLGVGRNSSGTVMVGFGTGRFISNTDVPGKGVTAQTQSLYGIIDTNTTVNGRAELQARTIPYWGKDEDNKDARGFESYSALPADMKGWYLDLPTPERVIGSPTISGTGMFLTSVIPADGADCSGATGSGYFNAINLFTGTAPKSGSYFADTSALPDGKGDHGVVGSKKIDGGMPTDGNLTTGLATIGRGDGDTPQSFKVPPPNGGMPSRISWRELMAQ